MATSPCIVLNNVLVSLYDISFLTEEDRRLVAKYLPRRAKRARKFHYQEDRDRCLAAGLLLITELGLTDESKISFGPNGKPHVEGVHFNLSHSGRLVAFAQSDEPLGIDVERMDEKHLVVAQRVFVPTELAWMERDPLPRFHTLWTQKESVLKLTGRGLGLDPRAFAMDPPGTETRTVADGHAVRTESHLLRHRSGNEHHDARQTETEANCLVSEGPGSEAQPLRSKQEDYAISISVFE